jgi:hypothetical protein
LHLEAYLASNRRWQRVPGRYLGGSKIRSSRRNLCSRHSAG